jgi:WD40 repeat protein
MLSRSLVLSLALAGTTIAQPRMDSRGDPLPEGAIGRIGTVRYRVGPIGPLALSPDGKTLAIESERAITLWEVDTGRPSVRISIAGSSFREPLVGPLAFTADGENLVYVHHKEVRVFDAKTGRWRHTMELKEIGIAVSPIPGTSRFAVTDQGRTAHVFDAATGQKASSIRSEAMLDRLTASGAYFQATHKEHCVLVDADTGNVRVEFRDRWNLNGTEFAVSPDDRRLYALVGKGRLVSFDAETGLKLGELDVPSVRNLPDDKGVGLSLSPDGNIAYLCKADHPTQRCDLVTNKWLAPLPTMPYGRLVPHPDGKRVLFLGTDGLLRRYDLATLREIAPPDGFEGKLAAVPSPDGRFVAVVSEGGRTDLFELDGRLRWSVRRTDPSSIACWSPDGARLLCVGRREIVVREAGAGTILRIVNLSDVIRGSKAQGSVTAFDGPVLFAADGTRMVIPLAPGNDLRYRAVVFDPRTGQRIGMIDRDGWERMALSPDGQTLATASSNTELVLVDLGTGKTVRFTDDRPRLVPPEDSEPIAYTPDGSIVLTWESRSRAVLRDAVSGRGVRTVNVSQSASEAFAFSPDGLWLATGGDNGLVALWDVVTGDQVWARGGHPEMVTSLGFAGPRRLVTGSRDLTALVWDLRPYDKLRAPAWNVLTESDPRDAYLAIWALADDPGAPALLRSNLPPVTGPTAERLRDLIADLGAPRFASREAATKVLGAFGRLAEPDLRAARATTADEEVRNRLDGLLSKLTPERMPAEVIGARAVAAMELAATAGARKVLTEWAAGAPASRLTIDAKAALRRLGPGR